MTPFKVGSQGYYKKKKSDRIQTERRKSNDTMEETETKEKKA